MDCGFQCFTVDAPGADPTCPIHSRIAGERAAVELAWREVTAEHTAQLEEQEARIARLEELVTSLRDAVAGIRGYLELDE
jgi:hypothetical protein